MKSLKGVILICLVSVTLSGCRLELNTPEKQLHTVVENNIAGMNNKDTYDVLDGLHSQSPYYEQMQLLLEEINKKYTLKSELVSFEYLGQAGEYATALTKQKTVKVDGPDFRNNVVSTMTIFRKEGEIWKMWQSLTLDIEFLDDEVE